MTPRGPISKRLNNVGLKEELRELLQKKADRFVFTCRCTRVTTQNNNIHAITALKIKNLRKISFISYALILSIKSSRY